MFNLIEDRKYQGFNIGVFNTIDEAIAEACYQFKNLSKKDKENFTYYVEDYYTGEQADDPEFSYDDIECYKIVNKDNYMELDCKYNNTDYLMYSYYDKIEYKPFIHDVFELYNALNDSLEDCYIYYKNNNNQKILADITNLNITIYLQNIKNVYNLNYIGESDFIVSIMENISDYYVKFKQ